MAKLAHPSLLRPGPALLNIEHRPSNLKSKHKVVLESVTREKKTLRSVISFKAEPPKGYTFIPAGNPEFTNALKDFAREGNYEIYAVSTTRHHGAHDLSQQVHRIGFHFPTVVVDQVCAHYGVVLGSAGTLLGESEHGFTRRSKRLDAQKAVEERRDQVTINTEGRNTIKDLFPNIPDNDLNQIIKTAFQIGQRKVGTAFELTLIRRAQLAVVAHIRHIYTNYDKLLRQTNYRSARNIVEKPTLRKLVQWRGDDDSGKEGLEDVFREVIVISDDDESSDDEQDDLTNDYRDVSVEIISSNTKAAYLDPDPPALGEPAIEQRRGSIDYTTARRPPGQQFVDLTVQNRNARDSSVIDRRGFSRYRAWKEARDEYRANPADLPATNDMGVEFLGQGKASVAPSANATMSARPPKVVYKPREPHSVQGIPPHLGPLEVYRGDDGQVYEARGRNHPASSRQLDVEPPRRIHPVSDTARREVPHQPGFTNYLGGHYSESKSNAVLPSVENLRMDTKLSPRRLPTNSHLSIPSINNIPGPSNNPLAQGHVDGIEFLDLTEDAPNIQKRRKLDEFESNHPTINRTGSVSHKQFSQRPRSPGISLLSPLETSAQPTYPTSGSVLRHPQLREGGQVSYTSLALPEGRRSPGHDGSFTRSPIMLRSTRRSLLESDFPTRTNPEPLLSLDQLRSTNLVSGAPVDRGIQDYRAFRARERRDKRSPRRSTRLRASYQGVDTAETVPQSVSFTPKEIIQLDGPWSSHDLVHPSPSQRQHCVVEDGSYVVRDYDDGLRYARRVEQGLPRRRSASPVGIERANMEYLPPRREVYLERQDDGFGTSSGVWNGASSLEEPRTSLFLRPIERHQEAKQPVQYLSRKLDDSRPRSATFRRYYAQL